MNLQRTRNSLFTILSVLACVLTAVWPGTPAGSAEAQPVQPPNGPRANMPRMHALVNARIVTAPGQVIEQGVVVIKGDLITAVGPTAEVTIPPECRVWDLGGKTVHAGFIDASYPVDSAGLAPTPGATTHWNGLIRPQVEVAGLEGLDEDARKTMRGAGFTAVNMTPNQGIFRGSAAVAPLSDPTQADGTKRETYLARGMQVAHFQTAGWGSEGYPESLIGAIALTRQTLYDAQWYNACWAMYDQDSTGLETPTVNEAYEALRNVLPAEESGRAAQQMILFESDSELDLFRAARLQDEFGVKIVVRGSGVEFKRLAEVAATKMPIVLPLNFPKAPKAEGIDDIEAVDLSRLYLWEQAPTNPRRLINAGVTVAFTTDLLRDKGEIIDRVRTAMKEGLTEEQALAALTTAPAAILGVSERMGTVEAGKAANLVVISTEKNEIFGKKREVESMWIDGQRYEMKRHPKVDPRGTWETNLTQDYTGPEKKPEPKLVITGKSDTLDDLKVEIKVGDEGFDAQAVDLRGDQLSFIAPAAIFHHDEDKWEQVTATVTAERLIGLRMDTSGRIIGWSATKIADEPKKEETEKVEAAGEQREGDESAAKPDEGEQKGASEEDEAEGRRGRRGWGGGAGDDEEKPHVPAPETYPTPLSAYGLMQPLQRPAGAVLVKNATVWTSGPEGILENADILIENGRFSAIGKNLAAPSGAMVIDAQGKHITPGLIDCHSHTGIDRWSVNEGTQAVTAEVRIGDVINPDDIDWYRQLAGGLTAANQLHGSANPIGGQNSVVKIRWGRAATEFPVQGAIPGIKFALGENVKQSNWGDSNTTRYPQTRMGVEQIIRAEFQSARDYAAARNRYEANAASTNPARMYPTPRDLELDAIAEILASKRLVHCHSYRQDEILMLIHVADEFEFTIGTFQHVLEGFKVAQEIAAHGAGASCFSDWWAYKVEVYDAIPYAGALMYNAGVNVSFNSDSDELARRMNTEAAKAVRYGGVPRAEALKFVTINPAKQLRIDQWTGSIEKGKDADFVIWSGDPLSTLTKCEQTWIDGTCYFSLEQDAVMRETVRSERQRIISKLLEAEHDAPPKKDAGEEEKDDSEAKPEGEQASEPPQPPQWYLERIESFLTNRDYLEIRAHDHMTEPNVCACEERPR